MKRFPRPKRLTGAQTRASLESFNASACFRTFYDTVCGGSTFVLVAFALSMGLKKERMGIISSVMSFACILQLMGLVLTNFVRDKKLFVVTLALAEPILMVSAVFAVPFLPAGLRIWALAVAVFLAAGALHLTRPVSDDWMAAVIPAGLRARFLGRRWQLVSLFTITSTLIAGFIAERIDRGNTLGFACIMSVGALFGAASVLALRRASMPALSATSRVTLDSVREAFRVRPFRGYLLATVIFNIPFMFACPYYQVFNLRIVEMKESMIALMNVGYFIPRIVAPTLVEKLIGRKGPRWCVYAFGPLYALFFLTFIVCTAERRWPLIVAWAVVGIADATYSVATLTALYAAVPNSPSRPAYFAIVNLTSLAAFGVGALLAIPILHALENVQITLGPLVLGQFHVYYGVAGVLMLVCTLGGRFLMNPQEIPPSTPSEHA